MRQLFYYKMRQKFITKCVSFFITKCDSFTIKCDSYYEMRRFYYKMRRLLQIATVHSLQTLYKKAVPKNFANFNEAYGYWSPFLSSCRDTACNKNDIKNDSPIHVLCFKFYEISQNNFT